jgi:hypothetical protein
MVILSLLFFPFPIAKSPAFFRTEDKSVIELLTRALLVNAMCPSIKKRNKFLKFKK